MNSSSRGPSACDGGVFPTLVAPGDGVRTADLTFGGLVPDATTEVIGTSFAAPHVAGAMALLLSAHPQATLDQLEQALRAGAEDLGADGPDNDSGYGRLDVVKAEAELAALVGGDRERGGLHRRGCLPGGDRRPGPSSRKVSRTTRPGAMRDHRPPPRASPVRASTGAPTTPDNDITTGGGPARTGDWGFYSLPHGDQTADRSRSTSSPMDSRGRLAEAMNAVGGWFVSTAPARRSR